MFCTTIKFILKDTLNFVLKSLKTQRHIIYEKEREKTI